MIKENQDKASLVSFYNEIENYLKNTHVPIDLTTDPNVTYNLLAKNYTICQEETHKPVKTGLNNYMHKKNAWITMSIIKSIKFRDEMYKRPRLTISHSPMYETLE